MYNTINLFLEVYKRLGEGKIELGTLCLLPLIKFTNLLQPVIEIIPMPTPIIMKMN